MRKGQFGLAFVALTGALTMGCGGDDDGPAPMDAGIQCTPAIAEGCVPMGPPTLADAGTPPAEVTCTAPDGGTPGEGICCYNDSQADSADNPELRLRYLELIAPEGSDLTGPLLQSVLNSALDKGTFAWLVRVEGAEEDGPITVRTGFGMNNGDGTYAFPTGSGTSMLDDPKYAPVELTGTITGQTVTTERYSGSLTVPVLNEAETAVQLELVLRDIQLVEGGFTGEDRSCVGWFSSRGRYATGAVLDGYIEVATARTGEVVSGPVMTTVCAAIAGALTNKDYCEERDQCAWRTKPDSLCTEAGCTPNQGCMEDVCDRSGDGDSGLPACNAWRLVARFAATGVEITN